MGLGIAKKEKQQVLSTLTYATHKMIKELELGKMVGNLDFYHFCEGHFKGGHQRKMKVKNGRPII